MKKAFVTTLLLILTVANGALASEWTIYAEYVGPANTEELSLFNLPDGSGLPLTEAMAFGGETRDGSFTVRLTTEGDTPIELFPWEDIWLESEVETDGGCIPGGQWYTNVYFPAEEATDQNGCTTFDGSAAGGGWTESPVWVYMNGQKVVHPEGDPLPALKLRFNSADINADGKVDLNDISIFATDYYGDYMYRSDFHWDGVMDLNDLAIMASSIGHNCN